MNQFKQLIGLPITITKSVRSSSLSRSAGNTRRDPKSSGESSLATSARDHSPELKLSEKSYARLIADCSRAIETKNRSIKSNNDQTTRGANVGFFWKTPFERLAGAPSLTKIKSASANAGSSLSTKSSSEPPSTGTTAGRASNVTVGLEHRETLEQLNEHHVWFDRVVEAHRTKQTTRKKIILSDRRQEDKKSERTSEHKDPANIADDASSQKTPEHSKVDAKSDSLMGRRGQKRSELGNNETDARNVSVTVKALEAGDAIANKLSSSSLGDNAVLLVTVTEESNTTTESSPLRHIDLRINGEPASVGDTMITKVEKLDVVSMAEKIEIRIPVLSKDGVNLTNEAGANCTSTINLCISNSANETVNQIVDDDSVGARIGSARSSTFYVTKITKTRKSRLPRSKVVPWWTTEESFRRSEIATNRSSETATAVKQASASSWITRTSRGNDQRTDQRDAKKGGSKERAKIKTIVCEPSGCRQRSRARRKATSAVSSIIENELRKNESGEWRGNVQYREAPATSDAAPATKPMVKHATKLQSSVSNQTKEGGSSVIVKQSATKSDPTIMPTSDKPAKKVPTTVNTLGEVTGVKSTMRRVEPNDHFSERSHRNEIPSAKPISIVAVDGSVNKTSAAGTTNAADVPEASDLVTPKTGSEARREITSKSEIKVTPEPPKTRGIMRLPPTEQSSSMPPNRINLRNDTFIRQNDKTAGNNAEQLANNSSGVHTKPIEKKKDGTLIDYGLTVQTGKPPERKLPDSRSAAGHLVDKKIAGKEEAAVVATIKEVIPTGNKGSRGLSINRGIVYPARLKQNGLVKTERGTINANNRKHHPCNSRETVPRTRLNVSEDSKISKNSSKAEKKYVDSSKVKNFKDASAEKKLLYSAWLRGMKQRNGLDPNDTSKGPGNSEDSR